MRAWQLVIIPETENHNLIMERSRGWCFTINNYTDDDFDIVFATQFDSRYCVWGKEVGESGTPHLQGYVYYDNPRSFGGVKLLFPKAHIEKQRGSCKQASDYCKKEGDYWEHGDLPMSDSDKGECGKQSIEERWALAKEGRFEELPPEQYLIYKRIYHENVVIDDRDELDNIWIFGPSGCGKSRYVRDNFPGFYSKGINMWWDGYAHEETVVIDDIDPSHAEKSSIGYRLKIWADHYAFNAEIKGGMLKIRPKRIIVTSQYSIDAVFPDEETRAAIHRRFKKMTWCPAFKTFIHT